MQDKGKGVDRGGDNEEELEESVNKDGEDEEGEEERTEDEEDDEEEECELDVFIPLVFLLTISVPKRRPSRKPKPFYSESTTPRKSYRKKTSQLCSIFAHIIT